MKDPLKTKPTVFVSYSHRDRIWLDRLQKMLKPSLRQAEFTLWADTRIKPGQNWLPEIETALAKADVALLLVSADFFASDFIANKELLPLLDRAKTGGLSILWVPIDACLWEETGLAHYQAAWEPSKPLLGLRGVGRSQALKAIAQRVLDAVQVVEESSQDPNSPTASETRYLFPEEGESGDKLDAKVLRKEEIAIAEGDSGNIGWENLKSKLRLGQITLLIIGILSIVLFFKFPWIFMRGGMYHEIVNIGQVGWSKYEVTNEEYLRFVIQNPMWQKGKIPNDLHDGDYLKHWSSAVSYPVELKEFPVTYVSWHAAKAYCDWVNARLPFPNEVNEVIGQNWLRWKNEGLINFCDQNCEQESHKSWLDDDHYMESAPVTLNVDKILNDVHHLCGNVSEWVNVISGEKRGMMGGSFLSTLYDCKRPEPIWYLSISCMKDAGFRPVWDHQQHASK